jgi:hypothetical protein
MRAVLVVVADVLIHEAFQMQFIENDHMVEQIAAAVADPALSHAILPRTSVAGPLGLDAKALHSFDYIAVEVRAANLKLGDETWGQTGRSRDNSEA